MKTTKTLKLITAILSVALLIGVALAIAVSAEVEAKSPEIISYNVEYGEKYALMYAVDASTVNSAPVTLDLYTADPATGAESIRSYTAEKSETIKIDGVETEAYVFTTDGVAAKNLTQIFYAQATDKAGAKGNVVRYSVIEYMYQRLSGQQEITANQETLYRTVIELASISAQVLINDKNEGTENDVTLAIDYSYVFFPAGNGLIGESADATSGYKAGIYAKGTVIYPYIPSTENLTVTVYDDNAAPAGSKVIKNGSPFSVSGDMTIITAGGELAYSPDLTDTAGRLCFDDDSEQNSYTKISKTDNSGEIISGAPYGTASKVYKHVANANKAEIAFVTNYSAPETANAFIVELDCMFEGKSSFSWYINIRNYQENPDEWRLKVNAEGGTVDLMGAGNNKAVAKLGEWFRYKVAYTMENGAYVIKHYVNDELIHTDTSMDKSSAAISIVSMNRLRFYAESSGVGTISFDNVKTYFD